MLGNKKDERMLKQIKNSFTVEFWSNPESIHQNVKQSQNQLAINNRYGDRPWQIGFSEAGICFSVGLNGITVYEQYGENLDTILEYETSIHDLTHIAVVYDDKRPYLFINGDFILKGKRSSKYYVYPSGIISGAPELFPNGGIEELRIWDYNRTEAQIRAYMNKKLDEGEEGLYGVWSTQSFNETKTSRENSNTPRREKSRYQDQKSNNNQNIEVSIIIPSYNKYPLNLFTLYSLENQTFDPSKMEVIFIDDASTDQTEKELKNYNPPYHFTYIRSEQNIGRSKVRNLGINSSKGEILIFLDAEMITLPDFVNIQYQYHQSNKNVILSGAMYSKNVISCIFPEFNSKKLKRISELTENNAIINKRFKNYNESITTPYPLIDKTDIMNNNFDDLIVKPSSWFSTITRNFSEDLAGFQFPWMAFLTGNVSLRKELIMQAGLFDEDFVNYGYEDWELGYRLYLIGAKYIINDELITYHQEHPVGESKWKEAIENFNRFTSKHHDVDVLILGLELANFADLLTMNKILAEYKHLVENYPDQFKNFQKKFITILETIKLLLQIDIRHFNVLGASGFGSRKIKRLQKDIEKIKDLSRYEHLTKCIDKILNT